MHLTDVAGPQGKAGEFSVDEAIAKANTLIEAMGWIRQFRGKTTVIKLGGSVVDDEVALMHILLDVIFMESVGMKPVLVHGGGKAISRAMADAGIEPNFIRGRRVTDEQTLQVVERVLAGELNVFLTEEIERLGGRAMNLSFLTTNVLFGDKLQTDDGGDLGFVGEVTRVDRDVIESLSYTDQVPGHSLDVRGARWRTFERQCRYRGDGRRTIAGRRKAGFPFRCQRSPPRQRRSQHDHPFALRR